MYAIISIILFGIFMDQTQFLPFITRVCFAIDGIIAIFITYWRLSSYWYEKMKSKGKSSLCSVIVAILIA